MNLVNMARKRGFVPALSIIVLAFIYIYPRILIDVLGKENPWTSYLYMYGFGLVTFLIGLLLLKTSQAYQKKRYQDRFWFKVLIGGFIFFSSLHAFWIYLATSMPYKGDM